MKKIISLVLTLAMFICCVPTGVLAAEVENSGEFLYDMEETATQIITTAYKDGVMIQRATTNKETTETVLELFDGDTVTVEYYTLNDHIKDVDLASIPDPAMEFEPTYSYDIYKRIRTDYLYQGAIMYGDTYTMAHETSRADRYEGHTLQFSAGTAASVIYNAMKVALKLAAGVTISQAMLIELGFEIAGGVLIDSITTTVCFTKYYVSTKVYFNGTLTVHANNTYSDIIVAAGAGGVDHYSSGLLGYDVVSSWASTCCSNGAVAFQDKYVTGHNPDLALPITSIPYYGW